MTRFASLTLLVLVGCNQTTIKDVNRKPDVTLLSPKNGASFEEGTPVSFDAVVDDDDRPETVTVRWESDQDGVLQETLAGADGHSKLTSALLSPGIHDITVTAVDPDGAVGSADNLITITDVADPPTVVWNHPTTGEQGMEGQSFTFSVVVGDLQDDLIMLAVTLSSDVDGDFCTAPPDQVGLADCAAILSVGQHTLTASVTDMDSNTTTADSFFEVLSSTTLDNDSDGWTGEEGDCNDSDPSINPGATEVDNNEDDNCDGIVDEETGGFDDDGDCYCELGPCDGSVEASCTAILPGDCDDANQPVNPGATESCDNRDEDCDGRIDEDTSCSDDDLDGFTELAGDCNDADGTIRPGALESADGIDQDCDNIIDEGTSAFDDDGDCYCESGACTGSADVNCTSPQPGDCDDSDNTRSPGATEACNQRDDDCDNSVDESDAYDAGTWYMDSDNDQYGDPNITTRACFSPPFGYVSNSLDCDDSDAAEFPGAQEVCDGDDDDCDGQIDEAGATGGATSYQDSDSDSYGNPYVSSTLCTPPAGFVLNNSDCDDTRSSSYPGASEYCNLRDDNCDGQTDESTAVDVVTWYRDSDGDNYGNSATTQQSCSAPAGYVAASTDCNDSSASINPGANETCNSIDDDCDGTVDDGVLLTWYRDADGDTYGTANTSQQACTQPVGYVSNNTDCNDLVAGLNPTTVWYRDSDGDGYGSSTASTQSCTQPAGYVINSTDCNDASATDSPIGIETCGDTRDNDCDGQVDEENASACTTYYYDFDGDGYGSTASHASRCYCSPTSYYTSTLSTDCYDSNAYANPGASTYRTSQRGDNSYDYNCDGSQTRRYSASYTCTGAVYICLSNTDGFTGSTPSCGNSATWGTGCTASLTTCTYSSTSSVTQACR